MVNIHIKNGTPGWRRAFVYDLPYAHIVRGVSASQKVVRCRRLAQDQEIAFPVCQCSCYEDKRIASLWDMQQIA